MTWTNSFLVHFIWVLLVLCDLAVCFIVQCNYCHVSATTQTWIMQKVVPPDVSLILQPGDNRGVGLGQSHTRDQCPVLAGKMDLGLYDMDKLIPCAFHLSVVSVVWSRCVFYCAVQLLSCECNHSNLNNAKSGPSWCITHPSAWGQ